MKRFHDDISVILNKLRKLYPNLYGGVKYTYHRLKVKVIFEYEVIILEKDGIVLIANHQLKNQKEVLKYLKLCYESLLEKCSQPNK